MTDLARAWASAAALPDVDPDPGRDWPQPATPRANATASRPTAARRRGRRSRKRCNSRSVRRPPANTRLRSSAPLPDLLPRSADSRPAGSRLRVTEPTRRKTTTRSGGTASSSSSTRHPVPAQRSTSQSQRRTRLAVVAASRRSEQRQVQKGGRLWGAETRSSCKPADSGFSHPSQTSQRGHGAGEIGPKVERTPGRALLKTTSPAAAVKTTHVRAARCRVLEVVVKDRLRLC